MTAVSRPIGAGREGVLYVPLNEETAEHLDLEALVMAEISDRHEPRLNHTFSYWPQEQMIVGEIRSPGYTKPSLHRRIHGFVQRSTPSRDIGNGSNAILVAEAH